jgi:nicotinamidase/pyrazinamidase
MPDYDASTAVIVVDLQNDFADGDGSLYVPGGEETVAVANEHIERALASGGRIFYTQDWHPERTPHFATDGGVWPVHCVRDTWGAQLQPALRLEGSVVRKGANGEDGYSGFTMRDPETGETRPTELDALLQEAAAERLVILGLATDYCVKATALDAAGLGYQTTVIRDGIRAVDLEPGDGQRAIEAMREAGVIIV